MGWALWRTAEELPEELVFRVNYLGGDMPTFALNFSRPGAQVVAQYYTFLRLGREGYRAVQQTTRDVARGLAERIEALGDFRLLTRGNELPVFAFTTTPEVDRYDVFDVSRRLRERGWLVPAYTFPANREDLSVLRVVCRNGFSSDLADLLIEDLARLLPELRRQAAPAGPGRVRGHRRSTTRRRSGGSAEGPPDPLVCPGSPPRPGGARQAGAGPWGTGPRGRGPNPRPGSSRVRPRRRTPRPRSGRSAPASTPPPRPPSGPTCS